MKVNMEALALFLTIPLFSIVVHSTTFYRCKGQIDGTLTAVSISDCDDKPLCILKRGTQPTVEVHFTPSNDIEELKNRVFAKIIGVPFPFVGVNGASACANVYQADGTTFAGCPLSANTDYVYKNSFEIYSYYPSVSPRVHWALQDASNSQDVICFEVAAQIQ